MADYRMMTLKADATPIVRGARMVSAQGDMNTWLEAAQKAADRAGKSTATVQITNGGGRLVQAFTLDKEGKVQAPQPVVHNVTAPKSSAAALVDAITTAPIREGDYVFEPKDGGRVHLYHQAQGAKRKTDLTSHANMADARAAMAVHQGGAQGTVTEVPVIRTNSPGQAGPVLIKKGVVQGLVDLLVGVPASKPGYTVDELVEQLVTAFGGSSSSRKNTVRTQMSASWLPKTRGLTIIKTPVEGKGTHYRAELPEEEGDDVE